jgi:hypothetical protein
MARTVLKGIVKTSYDSGLARGRILGKTEGKTEGKVEGKVEDIISILQNRFNRVPKKIVNTVTHIPDPETLDTLFQRALTCQSLSSFSESLD